MLSGDNGILQRATQSKEKTERAEIIETAQMDILGKQTENSGEISEKELKQILLKYGNLSENEDNILDKTLTTTKGNYKIEVSEIYNGELKPLKAGLYNADTGELIYDWNELLELGNIISVNDTTVSRHAFNVGDINVKLVIDESITKIGSFPYISQLKEVVTPSSVTEIEADAFNGCSNLTKINIPSRVLSIGDRAFMQCTNLTKIVIPDSVVSLGAYVFQNCSNLQEVTLPESVTSLGQCSFQYCTNLTKITILGNITSWGTNEFLGCSSLEQVILGDTLTSIGNNTFSGCSALNSITIPSSMTSIGSCAFLNCSSLNSITIKKGTNTLNIGRSAFNNSGLTDIYYTGSQEEWTALVNIDNTDNGDGGNESFNNATKHWNS